MKTLVTAARLLAAGLLALALATGTAQAQVPPHQPGSICLTPSFWCWAQVWGQVGALCYCGTAGGSVAGQYV